jgi:hypothetical protein
MESLKIPFFASGGSYMGKHVRPELRDLERHWFRSQIALMDEGLMA